MWNFQRIICIWICCVSCMFGTTQLSSLVQAVPYEYFDDHDQSFYDLDTEQIQAKYDARLLSQQMLKTEQQQQHLENKKGSLNSIAGLSGRIDDDGSKNILKTKNHNDADSSYILTKLKSNDGHVVDGGGGGVGGGGENDDDDDWLEDTATVTAASAAITENIEEIHLPRAASCYTNGQKYTHGQKVPRLDNCEVCLCMDGEIFCWWEKCDKKPTTRHPTTYDDYSTPYEESSTTRIQLNPKTTYKTTIKPIRKPKLVEDYKYDDDDSAEIREMQKEYEGIKEQLMMNKEKQQQQQQQQHKIHHNKQMVKKKMYQQHEEEKHNNKKVKEQQNKRKPEQQDLTKIQKQQQHKANEHLQKLQTQQHHHTIHNHHNNGHDGPSSSSSGGSSKILNFPENLPSVLYYDYKTEEHHQHQHQHHEQHLKHQKQQQHEKELKHRQQQQQQQQQQKKHHVNRHHEYGQDFNTYTDDKVAASSSSSSTSVLPSTPTLLKAIDVHSGGGGGGSSTFKYFSNGNDNIYDLDLQTDSDILPEPPTKKPKLSTSAAITTTPSDTETIATTQSYHLSTMSTITTSSSAPAVAGGTTSTATITATGPLKKQNFSPWDYGKPNRDKIHNSSSSKYKQSNSDNSNNNNNNNESIEDILDADEQDDAFHRWLTSTETNNKNNFTLNSKGSSAGGGGVGGGGGRGFGDTISVVGDYNADDKNYENIDIDIEAGTAIQQQQPSMQLSSTIASAIKTMTTMPTTLNALEAEAIFGEDLKTNRNFENSGLQNYEQNFSDYNSNGNSNTNNIPKENLNIDNSNGILNSNSNNNFSPFSNPYQNYNKNNNMVITTGSKRYPISPGSSINSKNAISSTTSNEENGVANVVNIDIMLTASSAESQQQQQQIDIKTTHPQQQQQHEQQLLLNLEHEKQILTQQKFVQPPVLISNTNDVDDNKKLLSSITNDNNSNNSNSKKNTTTNIVSGLNVETIQTMGVNLLNTSTNITNNNYSSASSSSSRSSQPSSVSYKFNHLTLMSNTTLTNFVDTAAAGGATATPPTLVTTLSPERLCNVMGTLYKIGDVLPQDTGNCLQCICIDGSTSDDTPRVTCSPHNCPPLVLPDLFDATGY